MKQTVKASIIASLIILAIIYAFFRLAYLIAGIFDIPQSLSFPIFVRAVGLVLLGVGITLALWLLKYRRPETMIVSTYYTFRKLFTRTPIEKPSGRMELLVIKGPQRYLRHPLYFAVTAIFFGWGLLIGETSYLIMSIILLLWFRLIQIPFEEKELLALFGDQYRKYMQATPMLLPFTKRNRDLGTAQNG